MNVEGQLGNLLEVILRIIHTETSCFLRTSNVHGIYQQLSPPPIDIRTVPIDVRKPQEVHIQDPCESQPMYSHPRTLSPQNSVAQAPTKRHKAPGNIEYVPSWL